MGKRKKIKKTGFYGSYWNSSEITMGDLGSTKPIRFKALALDVCRWDIQVSHSPCEILFISSSHDTASSTFAGLYQSPCIRTVERPVSISFTLSALIGDGDIVLGLPRRRDAQVEGGAPLNTVLGHGHDGSLLTSFV